MREITKRLSCWSQMDGSVTSRSGWVRLTVPVPNSLDLSESTSTPIASLVPGPSAFRLLLLSSLGLGPSLTNSRTLQVQVRYIDLT